MPPGDSERIGSNGRIHSSRKFGAVKKRLSDPVLSDAERKVILKLLQDEQAKQKSSTEQRAVHER